MYDTTLDFEKKREEPIKYDREVYVKTVQAIEKIDAIKRAREKRFKNERIKEAKKRNVKAIDRLLTNKADYIKNKNIKDKYKDKQNKLIKKQIAEGKKSKLAQELMVNSDEEEDESENESSMDEEN